MRGAELRRSGTARAAALVLAATLGLGGCGLRSESSTAASTTTASTSSAGAGTTSVPTTASSTASSTVGSAGGDGTATTTTGGRTVPAEAKRFCDLIKSVTITDLPDANWTAGYQRVRKALGEAVPIAPPAIKVAISDLAGVVDSLAPEVDAGKVSSNAQLDLWFNSQDTATKTKVITAGKQIQLYLEGNCVG